jgi:hypothetical protein
VRTICGVSLLAKLSTSCRSISGESAVVDTDICDDWLKNKLPNLVNFIDIQLAKILCP